MADSNNVEEEFMEESAAHEEEEDAATLMEEQEIEVMNVGGTSVNGEEEKKEETTGNETQQSDGAKKQRGRRRKKKNVDGETGVDADEEAAANIVDGDVDVEKPISRRGRRRRNKIIDAETGADADKRCFKCLQLGHISTVCEWSSEVTVDRHFKLSLKMLRHDAKQKMLRNAVHVAGVTMEDFRQLCSEMIADLLCCHLYLLAGEERKWFVEMVFSSKESAASASESIPTCYTEVEVKKHDFHLKAEADDDSVPQCLSDRYEFHPLIAKENPQPGEKYMLSVAGVSDEKFQELYALVSHDILSLKYDSLPRTAETEKTGFLEVLFASSEAADQAHDFVRSFDDKVEMVKHRLRPRELARKLREKYEVSVDLIERPTSQGQSPYSTLARMLYIAPMSVEDILRLVEKFKTNVLTWKMYMLPSHENAMFVEMLCSSRDSADEMSMHILCQYPEVDVEIPISAAFRQHGEKLRHQYKFDARIGHEVPVIALLSERSVDVDHEDLSPFWEEIPSATDIFAPRNDDGTFKRYVIVWLPDQPLCVKYLRQGTCEIGGIKYTTAEYFNPITVPKLFEDMDKLMENKDASEAASISKRLQRKLEIVNYYLHWAGDNEFDDSDVQTRQKNLKKYKGLGLSKVNWCKQVKNNQATRPNQQRQWPQKRIRDQSPADYGEKRRRSNDSRRSQYAGFDDRSAANHGGERRRSNDSRRSQYDGFNDRSPANHGGERRRFNDSRRSQYAGFNDRSPASHGRERRRSNDSRRSQYDGLNAAAGLPDVNSMQMPMMPTMGNWQQLNLTRMGTGMGMGNMMTTGGMNTGFNREGSFNDNPRQSYSERGYGADPYEVDRGTDMYGDAPSGRHFRDRSSNQNFRNRQQQDYYEAPRAGTSQGAGAFNGKDGSSSTKAMKLLYGLTQLLK